MEQNSNSDDKRLIASLIQNTRANISAISKKTGLSPTSIRNKLKRLIDKDMLQFKPLFSARVLGSEAALLRIKGGKRETIIRILTMCNRVLGVMVVNDNEVYAMVYGRDKREIASLVSFVKYIAEDVDEVEIHYGRLPSDFMIPLKNDAPNCHTYMNDANVNSFCGNCLPSLRRNRA
jgi:DNA-binding Lrp family transcriptional regulator